MGPILKCLKKTKKLIFYLSENDFYTDQDLIHMQTDLKIYLLIWVLIRFIGGHQPKRKTKAADIRMILNLKFDEAINGKEIDINVSRKEKCSTCNGTGSKNGKTTKCTSCGGSGYIGQGGGFFKLRWSLLKVGVKL